MHRNELANEQIMIKQYPGIRFDEHIANLTLSDLIKMLSKELESGNDKEVRNDLTNLFKEYNTIAKKVFYDFLIEASKNNHHSALVKLITDSYKVSEDILEDHVKFNNCNDDVKNNMELVLCAQDTPTEVLAVISYFTNRSTNCQCTDLLWDNYFRKNINTSLYSLNNNLAFIQRTTKISKDDRDLVFASFTDKYTRNRIFFIPNNPNQIHTDSVAHIINSAKFICRVNAPNSEVIRRLATEISKNEEQICKYDPNALQELPPFLLDLVESMKQRKSPNPQ
jgi:hypothetical protein